MTTSGLEILYEDNHLLAVCKPAGVLTMGDKTGDLTLADMARDYLRQKYDKPGNVYLGVVHRLDRPVSGIVVFARTSKAASRLSDQFRRGRVTKVYHALVAGIPRPCRDTLTDWLLKDRNSNTVRRVAQDTPGAKRSVLSYCVLRSVKGQSLVEVQPETGRSHQIRVQLAGRNTPIVGDVKYGAAEGLGNSILLHAVSLRFDHPVRKTPVLLNSPAPFAGVISDTDDSDC